MCGTCGCASNAVAVHGHDDHHDRGAAAREGEGRVVALERDLLAANAAVAARNRARLEAAGTLALNLVSSPGAGKTTWLVATIRALAQRLPLAVVEGDQATELDAVRIRATGVPAVQVNTGKGCHLDAAMIARTLDDGVAPAGGVLFIENVGNLVCPAAFDLGEAARVVLASVTEGDDKPLKYPDIFATAALVLVSKADLARHVDFDLDRFTAAARRVRPGVEVATVSAVTGAGMERWLAWIERARARLGTAA